MPCCVSGFLLLLTRKWIVYAPFSGWVVTRSIGKFIRRPGIKCNSPRMREGWVLEISLTLIKHSLLNKCWESLKKLDLLVARILKARYFKHLDIRNAPIGINPSYNWRSLMWSKDVLNLGILWKVGNGTHINAQRDPWIPNLSLGRISSNITMKAMLPLTTSWLMIWLGTSINCNPIFYPMNWKQLGKCR